MLAKETEDVSEKTHVDLVIEGPVLSNGHEDRLMVGSAVDGGETVGARGKTRRDGRGELTVDGGGVQALEEGEHIGVGGGGVVEPVDGLHNDVRVTNDLVGRVQHLGSSEVVLLGVDEVASLHVGDVHDDVEGLRGGDGAEVRGVDELGGGHGGDGGDDTHGRRVAGPGLDLETVGEGELGNGRAEVDEVVGRGEGRNLAGFLDGLAVLQESGGDNRGVES